MKKKIVVVLVAPIAGGKGVVSNNFAKRGFATFSLSDHLRKECKKRKLKPKTETLRIIGNGLRKKYGASVLAKKTSILIDKTKAEMTVVDGIRNPNELLYFQQKYHTYVLGIKSSFGIRFQRHLNYRKRKSIQKEFLRFQKINSAESGINQGAHGLQINACLNLVDEIINNEDDMKSLEKQIDEIIKKLQTQN